MFPILFALALRALGLFPFILDDDEAWFAVSGISLNNPGDYYSRALDNKPPGMTWFYHAIASAFGPSQLPVIARAMSLLLIFIAAQCSGAIAVRHFKKTMPSGASAAITTRVKRSACIFTLLGLSAFHPKALSVSNEGLMIPAICLSYRFARENASTRYWLLSGSLLGAAALIKQTAILFICPLLLQLRTPTRMIPFMTGFLLILGAGIWSVGPTEFWYWTWAYPASVLLPAREVLFQGWNGGSINAAAFFIALWPLCLSLPHFRDPFLLTWLLSAALAVIAGKGLFAHYFLLLVPPLAILASIQWTRTPPRRWMPLWLWGASASCCLIAAYPPSGILWGNDLDYFSHLNRKIRTLHLEKTQVHIWGANPLPLAMAGLPSYGRFVTSRFIAPPYATPHSLELFELQLQSSPPALLIDLHSRGDNHFGHPVQQIPALATELTRNYRVMADPALPWVRFFARHVQAGGSPLAGFCSSRELELSSDDYQDSLAELRVLLRGELREWRTLRSLSVVDRLLRIRFTLEILQHTCPTLDISPIASIASQSKTLLSALTHGIPPDPKTLSTWEELIRIYFSSHGFQPPFTLDNPQWWFSLALVELQPVASPR